MSPRVPPEGQALDFIENTGTGSVHILPWNDSEPTPVPPGGWGDAIAALLTAPATTDVVRLPAPPHLAGGPGQPVSSFPDEALCAACVRALGDQSVRAFEHPQPGDDQL
jgi:hypothetical protein